MALLPVLRCATVSRTIFESWWCLQFGKDDSLGDYESFLAAMSWSPLTTIAS